MSLSDGKTVYGLVADIGGTNARFALVELTSDAKITLLSLQKMRCADYPTLAAAVREYYQQADIPAAQVQGATIAVAGPVEGDWFEMTNNPWAFSIQAIKAELGLQRLALINDYAAQAWAVTCMTEQDYVAIGTATVDTETAATASVGVLGPGTGLGIGGFVRQDKTFIALQTEGGHANFAPTNEIEMEILKVLMHKYGRVSNERLLSGQGLVDLYHALAQIESQPATELEAAEISAAAVAGKDMLCVNTLNQFCATLGSVAGDLALLLGAKAGVYIAGGIVPRFVEFFKQSPFRKRFEAKGRFSAYNAAIPTRLIIAEQPGLLGAAAHQRANCLPD